MTWILMAIFSVNDFPTIWLLTGGGPDRRHAKPCRLPHQLVFDEFRTGQGIAAAMFATLITAVMAIVLFRFIGVGSRRGRIEPA